MTIRPKAIYLWTTGGWFLGMCLHLLWSLVQQRSQEPTDEVYTQLLSFQLASFCLTSLPYWLGALIVILISEFAVFGRKST